MKRIRVERRVIYVAFSTTIPAKLPSAIAMPQGQEAQGSAPRSDSPPWVDGTNPKSSGFSAYGSWLYDYPINRVADIGRRLHIARGRAPLPFHVHVPPPCQRLQLPYPSGTNCARTLSRHPQDAAD
jgi:hypothetical protein